MLFAIIMKIEMFLLKKLKKIYIESVAATLYNAEEFFYNKLYDFSLEEIKEKLK